MIWEIMLLFVIAIIYIAVCWFNQCKWNHMLFPKKGLDVINLGSTYAYYDFNYSNIPVTGMNLANIPQYLDYDLIILKKYLKYLKQNAKVLIVLPDFVFCGKETPTKRKVYYEALKPWEIKNFSIRELLKYIFLSAKEPFSHDYEKQRNKWKGYEASYDEKKRHAERRVLDWEGKLGIPSVKNDSITDELREQIQLNIQRIDKIINICNCNSVQPVIIIPPVSDIQRNIVHETCIRRYLYEPIMEVQKNTGIKVLDYLYDEEMKEVELYMNSDCLNYKGVDVFMKKVYRDIWG